MLNIEIDQLAKLQKVLEKALFRETSGKISSMINFFYNWLHKLIANNLTNNRPKMF